MNIDNESVKKRIKLLELFDKAGALTIDDSPLLHSVEVTELTGEPDNVVVYATWETGDGAFAVEFTEAGLDGAVIDPVRVGTIKLEDLKGQMTTVTFFRLAPENLQGIFG